MKIRVDDLTALKAFDCAEIAAGRHSMKGRVRSVSVMDAGTPEEAVRENGVKEELVLTKFSGTGDEGVRAEIIKRLAEKEISGVVVFDCNDGAASLDDKVVEAALSVGLPLFAMSTGKIRYSDVIEQVMERLLYGASTTNDLINNTVSHLLDFDRHTGFLDALREAAVKNSFQVALFSGDFNPVLTVETRKREVTSEVVRLGKKQDVGKDADPKFVDVNGVYTYWHQVTAAGNKYQMMIVDNDDNYSSAEMAKLAEIIELAMGMWKYTPKRDVKAEFIKALMRGNVSLAYTLSEETGISGEDIVSVFTAKEIDDPIGNEIISKYETMTGFDIMRLTESGETSGIVISGKGNVRSDIKELSLKMYEELGASDENVRIFQATGITGFEGAGDAFRLIGEVSQYMEIVFPEKRVFTKYELTMVAGCIDINVAGGHQRKNYMDLLIPLYRDVGEHKVEQLLKTLETFVLDSGMSVGRTSEYMGVHANTVQYRLKKLNEVLGTELTSNGLMPGLATALALSRLERSLKNGNMQDAAKGYE